MKFPLVSIAASLLIWFAVLAIFSHVISSKSKNLPTSITIDAAMVGKVERENKSAEKSEKFLEKNSGLGKEGLAENAQVSKEVAPLFAPLPKIPEDLRGEAFSSEAIARFHISAEGLVVKVELVKPCSNPRLNQLLVRSLHSWKFLPSSQSYMQDIRVHFEVE